MSDELLIPGESSEIESTYIGPERALRVDTDNDELRLHDGSKPGGFRFLNHDANLQLFQRKSTELDGFKFHPALKGFMVRTSPGQYRLRSLSFHAGQFTVTNPSGIAGNPSIQLSATITTVHTWEGQQTFVEAIAANGGVEGDLTGDSTGSHTGPVTGDVIGNLTGDSTGAHVGSVDVRGHTLQLDEGQIPYSALSGVPAAPDAIPSGCILLWSGAADGHPSGWVICDGDNGTPDLRGRFIIGAYPGGNPEVASTGGTDEHNHVITMESSGDHTHTGTVEDHTLTLAEIPAHQHGSGVTDNSATDVFNHTAISASPTTANSIESNSADGIYEGQTKTAGGSDAHNHGLSLDNDGTHTHDAASELTSHLPPYYALCYIMKV